MSSITNKPITKNNFPLQIYNTADPLILSNDGMNYYWCFGGVAVVNLDLSSNYPNGHQLYIKNDAINAGPIQINSNPDEFLYTPIQQNNYTMDVNRVCYLVSMSGGWAVISDTSA